MRPTNYTTLSAAVPKNTVIFNFTADPGLYSANYKYPTANGGAQRSAADDAIATGDYVAYQMDDGTWQADLVASVSTLAITLTTGTPNLNGATIAAGKPVFFFAVGGETDPATGQTQPGFDTIVSTRNIWQSNSGVGLVSALHPGDPLLFLDANGTAADFLNVLSGYYGQW